VRDYVEDWYLPAASRSRGLAQDDYAAARELVQWRARVAEAWHHVAILAITHEGTATVGDAQRVWADVTLGTLDPNEVQVQLWHGRVDGEDQLADPQLTVMQRAQTGTGSTTRYVAELASAEQGHFGFSVRVVPSHPQLRDEVHTPYVVHDTADAARSG
jgi:starch phosphorylase